MYMLPILISGFAGGVVRGLIGFIKHQYSYKNVGFKLPYFLGMMFISGAVGFLTALAVKEAGISFFETDSFSPGIALIVGYAGGDFLENIYKIISKKIFKTK